MGCAFVSEVDDAILTRFHAEKVQPAVPDGRRWVAKVNVAPLRDGDGAVVGAINCFQDVSREHEMRLALERHQRTFDLAMVAAQMGKRLGVGPQTRYPYRREH